MEFQYPNLETNLSRFEALDLPVEQEPMTVLPRSGWENKVRYLKLLFRTKQILDRQEQEASSNLN
jgi:hypothetical protein